MATACGNRRATAVIKKRDRERTYTNERQRRERDSSARVAKYRHASTNNVFFFVFLSLTRKPFTSEVFIPRYLSCACVTLPRQSVKQTISNETHVASALFYLRMEIKIDLSFRFSQDIFIISDSSRAQPRLMPKSYFPFAFRIAVYSPIVPL